MFRVVAGCMGSRAMVAEGDQKAQNQRNALYFALLS
jgi:hypothetical protein